MAGIYEDIYAHFEGVRGAKSATGHSTNRRGSGKKA
jgi:hypothetical protein